MTEPTRRRWTTLVLGLAPVVLVFVFGRNDADRKEALFSALIAGILLSPVAMGMWQRWRRRGRLPS